MTPLGDVLRRQHLPALDGLRAVAVFTVIFSHGGLPFLVPGDLGVTGFFVLSGFLITLLLIRERAKTGRTDLGAFYVRRTLRIFPAYFALVFLSIGADLVLGDPWTMGRVVSAVTYTLNYHNALFGHEGPVAHAWSLAVEEQFYLLWPAAFILLARARRPAMALAVMIVGVLAWRCLLFVNGSPDHYLYNAFETRFDSLAIGCVLAVLATARGRTGEQFLALAGRFAARGWYPLITVALLLASRTATTDTWRYTVGFTVDSLLVGVLIVQLLQLAGTAGWRWMDHRLAVWLGMLSYPLYLWHAWGLDVGHKVPGPAWLSLTVGTAACIGLAAGSYYVIEKPFLRMKERFTRARSPKEEPAERAPAMAGA